MFSAPLNSSTIFLKRLYNSAIKEANTCKLAIYNIFRSTKVFNSYQLVGQRFKMNYGQVILAKMIYDGISLVFILILAPICEKLSSIGPCLSYFTQHDVLQVKY